MRRIWCALALVAPGCLTGCVNPRSTAILPDTGAGGGAGPVAEPGGTTAAADAAAGVVMGGAPDAGQGNDLGSAGAASDAPGKDAAANRGDAGKLVLNATRLAAGNYHTCVVRVGGSVRCWGSGVTGAGVEIAVAVAAGGSVTTKHTCVVTSGGAVQCWGDNTVGMLGSGSSVGSATPVTVPGLAGASAVAASADCSCALASGGTVWCWGRLPDGTSASSPVQVVGPSNAVALSVAGGATSFGVQTHSCVLISDGSVQCWGSNGNGQLGDGTRISSVAPVTVAGLSGATAIAAGGAHSCAIISDGSVRCWGDNTHGQLGDGTDNSSATPVAVLQVRGAIAIAAGYTHTCAIVAGGAVECWGYKERGQLGDGTTTGTPSTTTILSGSSTPVRVQGLTGATALAAGIYHTCAAIADGSVYCWGDNDSGQLGNDNTGLSLVPAVVTHAQ
jgi:alpha-tubulin suppressor-like RCC1 family protein